MKLLFIMTFTFFQSDYVCDENSCDYKSKYVPRTRDEICTQCESGTLKKEVRIFYQSS